MSNFEEILNESIDRLIAGESLRDLLADHPQHADALGAALRDAQALLRSGPTGGPADAARQDARARMLAALDEARAKANEFQPAAGTVSLLPLDAAVNKRPAQRERPAWLASFMRRPAPFRAAALAGSVALFGALGVGAAAATGNTPEPVRELFRSSASTSLRVEFEGIITAIDPVARTINVDVAGDVRTVIVVDGTELSDSGDDIAFEAFAGGDLVEVKGALQPDDTIVASRVHREDDFDDEPDATRTPDNDDDEPDATRTAGHDDDDGDDDNSGPGNSDDDNSGPGNSDDDDGHDDDDSGPGNSDDDDGHDADDDGDSSGNGHDNDDDDGDDDNNSGPGNGVDGDDDNDDSGHGDGGDDNSGPDDGNDDGEDDDSGHGNGGDDDDNSGSGGNDDDD
jgi:hypothetical protein